MSAAQRPSSPPSERTSGRERAFVFGEPKQLFGILTEPAQAVPGRPAVLLLNAGLVHRVGPHRMSVRLARALAEAGYLAFRFDLSGIGDSEARRDTLSYADRAILDVRQAMDHLEKTRGITRFVSLGLCSGADNSYFTALVDERIVGIVGLDGFAYRSPRFYLEHYGKKALRSASWVTLGKTALYRARTLRRQLRARFGTVTDGRLSWVPEAPHVRAYIREFPPRAEYVAGTNALVQRGVRMLLTYSAGMHEYYTYDGQFWDAFPYSEWKRNIQVQFYAGSNHTFTELRFQDALVQNIVTWMRTQFA
jgi:pimeloyl-ACP methyl ester carboxylesterase